MDEFSAIFTKYIIPHWPFYAAVVIFYSVGEVMKKTVTKEMAKAKKWAWYFRSTLALHPIVGGVFLGLVPGMPASAGFDATTAGKCLYFAVAGALCSVIVNTVKQWAKNKGLKLGEEEKPPESALPSQPPPE
jgi:hypothetical protein